MDEHRDDRRQYNSQDHDILIRIETIVSENGKRLDGFMVETNKKIERHQNDIEFTNKVVYGFIGVVVFLEFLLKVWK